MESRRRGVSSRVERRQRTTSNAEPALDWRLPARSRACTLCFWRLGTAMAPRHATSSRSGAVACSGCCPTDRRRRAPRAQGRQHLYRPGAPIAVQDRGSGRPHRVLRPRRAIHERNSRDRRRGPRQTLTNGTGSVSQCSPGRVLACRRRRLVAMTIEPSSQTAKSAERPSTTPATHRIQSARPPWAVM